MRGHEGVRKTEYLSSLYNSKVLIVQILHPLSAANSRNDEVFASFS
jgi:hypothetical protein